MSDESIGKAIAVFLPIAFLIFLGYFIWLGWFT